MARFPWTPQRWYESTLKTSRQLSAVSRQLVLWQMKQEGLYGASRNMVALTADSLQAGLLRRARRHLLHHRQHQLSVTVVQIRRIPAHLAQEADFIVGELRQPLTAVGVAFGKELRQGQIHRPGYLGERVQRRDGVAVLNPRQVAAQQARTLFDVTL